MTHGRLPPHDLTAEAATLSAAMLSDVALDEAVDVVQPDDFFSHQNQDVARVVWAIHSRGEPVDVVTVANALRAAGHLARAGGAGYLAQLTDATPAVANVRRHAELVRDLSRVRTWIALCQKWAAMGYTEAASDPAGYLDAMGDALQKALDDEDATDAAPLRDVVAAVVAKSQALSESGESAGLSTGHEDVDQRTGGLHEGDLTVVAGRPGMGKTALACGWARAGGEAGDVYLWSGEMPREQVAGRLLAAEGTLDLRRLRQGRMTPDEWRSCSDAVETLAGLNIWIDDRPNLSAVQIRSAARRAGLRAKRRGSRLVLCVLDYLQLMRGEGDSRDERIGDITRGLKAMAKSLMVPVVALSQLNRGVESRSPPRPMLSDLRESGNIEQDADTVFLLYRPGYYEEQKGRPDDTGGKTEGVIAKQRNGPTGTLRLRWWSGCARFDTWED
jgi:replicative DNA helicase